MPKEKIDATTPDPPSPYARLQGIDPSKAITKKVMKSKATGKTTTLSYLSWVDAYHSIMSLYPRAEFTTTMFPYILNGTVVEGYNVPYLWTPAGAFVEVTINLGDDDSTEKICMLPVMDFRHDAVREPDARQVSDNTQRCLAKCAALHGFGIQVYAKEDLKDIGEEEGGGGKETGTPTGKATGKQPPNDPPEQPTESGNASIDQDAKTYLQEHIMAQAGGREKVFPAKLKFILNAAGYGKEAASCTTVDELTSSVCTGLIKYIQQNPK